MADELSIGLKKLLRKARMEHDPDLLKEGVRVLSQALVYMLAVDRSWHANSPPLGFSCMGFRILQNKQAFLPQSLRPAGPLSSPEMVSYSAE